MSAALQRIRRRLEAEASVYDGSVIPAVRLRAGGQHFRSDAEFVESGEREVDRLVRVGLAAESRLLEIGCGPGRLAIGLRRRDLRCRYVGVDVDRRAIDWCRRHLVDELQQFVWLDASNERYNREGRPLDVLPEEVGKAAPFDFAYLYSVFSHLRQDDVRFYLREFARLLQPQGTVFATAFLEDGVPDESENPSGYRREWTGPLHCVRYNRTFFEGLAANAGFSVARLDYETETDGQSAVVLRRTIA